MYGGYGMGAGYGPMRGRTVGVDVNGDGIADYRVRQGGFGGQRVMPGPGMGMGMGIVNVDMVLTLIEMEFPIIESNQE